MVAVDEVGGCLNAVGAGGVLVEGALAERDRAVEEDGALTEVVGLVAGRVRGVKWLPEAVVESVDTLVLPELVISFLI